MKTILIWLAFLFIAAAALYGFHVALSAHRRVQLLSDVHDPLRTCLNDIVQTFDRGDTALAQQKTRLLQQRWSEYLEAKRPSPELFAAEVTGLSTQTSTSAPSAPDAAAYADIARNHLELRIYGLPRPSDRLFGQLLRQRFNIEFKTVAGCVVTDELCRETDTYNKVMSAEIERRFGKNALEKLEAEAAAKTCGSQPAQ